uniref:phage N-6-adenine-methyltransferase n=1 Tax=Yersinia pseudotuberculosis TaxID=633 RepID=UPI0028BE9196|nr:phage N-6-adenine-methyltransferase [Yersinia pseudotuberculosis]
MKELKGAAFGNPPYSRAKQHEGEYITGMTHIMQHTAAMREAGGRYVFLIKVATSESWWPEQADHIAFIRGRVGFDLPHWFIPADDKQVPSGAFFAGAIAIFDKAWRGPSISYIPLDQLMATGEAFLAQIRREAERLVPETGNTVWPVEVNLYFSKISGAAELPADLQHKILGNINRMKLDGIPSDAIIAAATTLTAAISFVIEPPPVPVGVDVTAGNWSLILIPRFNGITTIGTLCEFWYYTEDIPIDEVTTRAKFVGTGVSMSHSGLMQNTTYFYWVRGINSYGKSAFFKVETKTTHDPSSIIELLDGEIGAEQLRDELRKPLEETIDMWTAKVGNEHIAGGIGLTIEVDDDGKERIKCIVDADIFAVVNRSANTNINPFVVKDGTIYINHLMADNAEFGAIISKYINVQHLVGTLIEGSTINGGQINGTNIYGSTITGTTMNANTINGGSINIANLFKVDGNGNIIMQATPDSIGMKITNQTITVYRGPGDRALALGWIEG